MTEISFFAILDSLPSSIGLGYCEREGDLCIISSANDFGFPRSLFGESIRESLEEGGRPFHQSDEKGQKRKDREHADGHQPKAFRNHATAPRFTSGPILIRVDSQHPQIAAPGPYI
jgi:hypothetical protein